MVIYLSEEKLKPTDCDRPFSNMHILCTDNLHICFCYDVERVMIQHAGFSSQLQ